jgi:hypothetical protein
MKLQTDGQADHRLSGIPIERKTERKTGRQMEKQTTDRQRDKQTINIQTDYRQKYKEMTDNIQTDKQT